VVFRSNHSQTVDFSFETQPRNLCFSSSCARYRPHTASLDLSIVRPPSIRPVRPCRSSAPCLILLPRSSSLPVIPHVSLVHHEASKYDSTYETKDKGKTMNYPGFKFKTHQVNDSLQLNQGTNHLISQSPIITQGACKRGLILLSSHMICLSCALGSS
jgi:hypothetical protein